MKISTTSPYKSLSDHELIAATYAGDEKALGFLLMKYHGLLHSFIAKRMLAHRNSVNDLVQDTFEKAFKALYKGQYIQQGTTKFSTWLCAIAQNHCIDFCRKHNRQKMIRLDDILGLNANEWSTIFMDTDRADAKLLKKERASTLLKCMKKLPAGRQKILHMHFFEGKLLREIEQEASIPIGTIKGNGFKAIQALKNDPELRAIAYA